jgi:hypothetical protein
MKSERLQSPSSLRLAVIAYRDHPPQDVSYITKQLPFTSDISTVKEFLKTLYASGGGDGPEAVTAAMKEALELDWRENASRITLLIADAPPHGAIFPSSFLIGVSRLITTHPLSFLAGIGEYGDGFAQGSPEGVFLSPQHECNRLITSLISPGSDPLQLARQMAAQGIALVCTTALQKELMLTPRVWFSVCRSL